MLRGRHPLEKPATITVAVPRKMLARRSGERGALPGSPRRPTELMRDAIVFPDCHSRLRAELSGEKSRSIAKSFSQHQDRVPARVPDLGFRLSQKMIHAEHAETKYVPEHLPSPLLLRCFAASEDLRMDPPKPWRRRVVGEGGRRPVEGGARDSAVDSFLPISTLQRQFSSRARTRANPSPRATLPRCALPLPQGARQDCFFAFQLLFPRTAMRERENPVSARRRAE